MAFLTFFLDFKLQILAEKASWIWSLATPPPMGLGGSAVARPPLPGRWRGATPRGTAWQWRRGGATSSPRSLPARRPTSCCATRRTFPRRSSRPSTRPSVTTSPPPPSWQVRRGLLRSPPPPRHRPHGDGVLRAARGGTAGAPLTGRACVHRDWVQTRPDGVTLGISLPPPRQWMAMGTSASFLQTDRWKISFRRIIEKPDRGQGAARSQKTNCGGRAV